MVISGIERRNMFRANFVVWISRVEAMELRQVMLLQENRILYIQRMEVRVGRVAMCHSMFAVSV